MLAANTNRSKNLTKAWRKGTIGNTMRLEERRFRQIVNEVQNLED